jgi:hypothetical protein
LLRTLCTTHECACIHMRSMGDVCVCTLTDTDIFGAWQEGFMSLQIMSDLSPSYQAVKIHGRHCSPALIFMCSSIFSIKIPNDMELCSQLTIYFGKIITNKN